MRPRRAIHHIDGNPNNNDPSNLILTDPSQTIVSMPTSHADLLRWAIMSYLGDLNATKLTDDNKRRLARMAWEIRDKLPPELATYAALLGGTDK